MVKLTKAALDKLFKSQVQVFIEIRITPALADEWLRTRNKGNRTISEPHVDMLARQMSAGNWLSIHQPIAFDKSGELNDGQHRLAAVVRSGVTVTMWVCFGANREHMGAVDNTRTRTPGDALAIYNGRTHPAQRAAVLRMLISLEHGRFAMKPSVQEIMAADQIHDKALTWLFSGVQHSLWFAPFAAALVYAYERKPDETAAFANLLTNPVGLPAGSPVIATITMMGLISRTGGSATRWAAFRKMLRGIAGYCQGKALSKLPDGEEGLRYFAKFPAAV